MDRHTHEDWMSSLFEGFYKKLDLDLPSYDFDTNVKIEIKTLMHIIKKTKDSVHNSSAFMMYVRLAWDFILPILKPEHAHTLMSGFGGELGSIVCPLE